MDRANELFDRIKSEGLAAIRSFVDDRKSEELFLDFKRSSVNGTGKKLSDKDRQTFGKAISGFGNSEGGVIVWGVDCSEDDKGRDVAHTLHPLEEPSRFESWLRSVASGCTIPAHRHIEYLTVPDEESKGYVITLIPKSEDAPHMDIDQKRYYVRAGSNFLPTPHDVLSGMFGRRPQPTVFHSYQMLLPTIKDGYLCIDIGIEIQNRGPGIAEDLFLVCELLSAPGEYCTGLFHIPDQTKWTCNIEYNYKLSMISIRDYRIPPTAGTLATVLRLRFVPPFEGDLHFRGRVGAGTSRPFSFEKIVPSSHLQSNFDHFVDLMQKGLLSNAQKHDLTRDFLQIEKNIDGAKDTLSTSDKLLHPNRRPL